MKRSLDIATASESGDKRQRVDEKDTEKETTWQDIPREIWAHIFTIAGYEWKPAFRLVCKLLNMSCPLVKDGPRKSYISINADYDFSMSFFLWAIENGCTTNDTVYTRVFSTGNMTVLKMLNVFGDIEPINYYYNAAENGQLEVLKWIREQGTPWCGKIDAYGARGGHLSVLKWLKDNDYQFGTLACSFAAKKGHLDVLKWLKECDYAWDQEICYMAAKGGKLHVLKWARENGAPWDENTCRCAAGEGHLHVLKWARENGCPWDSSTCSFAAKEGHLNILKWCKENGCPWDERTCAYAAMGGHLDVLKWARENGCPWDEWTCSLTVQGRYFNVLKWALENGCPFKGEFFITECIVNTQLLDFLSENLPQIFKSFSE